MRKKLGAVLRVLVIRAIPFCLFVVVTMRAWGWLQIHAHFDTSLIGLGIIFLSGFIVVRCICNPILDVFLLEGQNNTKNKGHAP